MLLSDSLTCALEGHDISGVMVFCGKKTRNDVMNTFLSAFKENWKNAMEKAIERYDDIDAELYDVDKPPVSISERSEGFFVSVGLIEIRYCYDEFYDFDLGLEALLNALKAMKKKHRSVEYEGCLEGVLADTKSGEAYHWDISTRDVETYDFIGTALANAMKLDLAENLQEQLACNEDYTETLEVLFAYSEYWDDDDTTALIDVVIEAAKENDYDDLDGLIAMISDFFS